MNENDAYIFDVEEPKDWTFKGNPVTLSGWFLSKQDAVFTDVRVVIDGATFPGIWGLPREDVERAQRGRVGRPHAGFKVSIKAPLGAGLLRLELRDSGGHWVEIWRKKFHARLGSLRRPMLPAALIPFQLRKLLQEHRARPAADLRPFARQIVLESLARGMETEPAPPFFGALETPLVTGSSQYGKLRVEGWIIHQEQRIRRLIGTTHPLVENELDYGDRPQAGIGERFPHHPQAACAQFFGLLDIDEQAGDPAYLQLYAELDDDSRHLVFVRRFHQRACNRDERPLPPYRLGLFLRHVTLLIAACRNERIRLGHPGDWWQGVWQAHETYRRFAPVDAGFRDQQPTGPYAIWQATNALTPKLCHALEEAARQLGPDAPCFTLLVDTRGCRRSHLDELAASLHAQIHRHWEVWFVGVSGAPTDDPRFKVEPMSDDRDWIRALNAALNKSSGTHVALLRGDSRLPPDALLEIAERLATNAELELIYTDEDRMDDHGGRHSPVFKPDWSPALADAGLFPGQLAVIRRERCESLGAFRPAFSAVPWYDLMLRLGDSLTASQVAHLPLIGHHARAGRDESTDPADPAVEQARQALAEALQRRGMAASAFMPETGHHRRCFYHQVRWDHSLLARLPVTIVIPTRDRLYLLQECIELLEETVDWRHVKLIIVDDHSRDADAVRYLAAIQQRTDLHCRVLQPQDRAAPFNYSHLVNLALSHLDTPLVLHLNNDVNALEHGWLEEMVGWFTQPDVGVVGAKLVYPDKTLNHTGIIIGPHGGLADTPYAKVAEDEVPVVEQAAAREVSAVTGACLMTRTDLYRALGGFDEKDFGVAYNDVDYCLRVRANGRRIIYTPQAKLMHWGSATRGVTFDDEEHIAFVRRYPQYRDPYFSSHLILQEGRPACRGDHFARPRRAGRLHLLLLTHNLNYEGAPLFLFEYASHMVRHAGHTVEVHTAQDGPLRTDYERLGIEIKLIDGELLYSSDTPKIFHQRLAQLCESIAWQNIDLVVCNTAVSFWGVHLARLVGKPSLLYIHESSSIFRFFEEKLRLGLHPLVHAAFSTATRVLFLCQATRAYYEDDNLHGNFRIVPSWIRLADIDAIRHTQDRGALRRKHGLDEDETIIANIGTVCERKGQHIYLRAIEHFNRQGHRGRYRFLMVGARPGVYLDLIERDLNRLGLPNVTLVPETNEAFDFFGLADLFVCTSYEESFPRVIMEAMAFRTPIVSTNVHGIAEMIGQRQQGYLVPPGDPVALSRMMWTCLAKERSGKSLTPTAYSKALRMYDHHKVLPIHADLAREACLSG